MGRGEAGSQEDSPEDLRIPVSGRTVGAGVTHIPRILGITSSLFWTSSLPHTQAGATEGTDPPPPASAHRLPASR